MARDIQLPGSSWALASLSSPSASNCASAPLKEVRSMHCCRDLPRARMKASSASPLLSACEGDLGLLFASSPRICLTSSCQG
eukprot:9019287-Pyramimonas_sp.AAC.1